MKMGTIEALLIFFPRIMLLLIVVLLVVIVVKLSSKGKGSSNSSNAQPERIGYRDAKHSVDNNNGNSKN
jgi:hypothetical protein